MPSDNDDTRMRPWPGLEGLGNFISTGPSRLFYFDSAPGDLSRPALLLVHGLGDEADSFRHLFPLLDRRFRILAPDLPGFGRSTTSGPTSFALCVAALESVLAAAGVEKALLAGSSLGAGLVEALAFTRPGLALGLVLIDGGLPTTGRPGPGLLAMATPILGRRIYTAYRRDYGAAIASLAPYYADFAALPAADRDFLARRVIDRVESDAQRRAYISLLHSAIWTGAGSGSRFAHGLSAWDGPLALVWGAEDRVMPLANGEALARLAPRAVLHLVEGAGHLPHQERPERVAALIEDLAPR